MIVASKELLTVVLIIVLLSLIRNALMCDNNICFNWKLVGDSIIFTCTVSNVAYRISIVDPKGFTKAHCLPLLTCNSVKRNDLKYPTRTNEIILKLPLETNSIDTLDGIWSCRHGSRRGTVHTEVSLHVTKGALTTETSFRPTNDQATLDWHDATGSTLWQQNLSMMHLVTTISQNWDGNSFVSKEHLLSAYFVPLIVVLAILFSTFALCNIWVYRNCSLLKNASINTHQIKQTKQRFTFLDQQSNSRTFQRQMNYNEGYEYINEENMIENSKCIRNQHFIAIEKERTEQKNNDKLSSLSSSENSYLEVIDDIEYNNSYESVIFHRTKNDEYLHCGIGCRHSNARSYEHFDESCSNDRNGKAKPRTLKFVGSIFLDNGRMERKSKSEYVSTSCPVLLAKYCESDGFGSEEPNQQKVNSTDILRSIL